ncbi:MAG: insulinase family protein [Cyclobacteriaceae bacterium]|nr:insulinase family protein [Cyclobacteriaceae bacterium]
MLNRKIAPIGHALEEIKVPRVEEFILSSGIPVYYYSVDEQPVVKIELLFDSSLFHEFNPAAGTFVSKLFKEGTHSKKSKEINQLFAEWGAFVECSANHQYFTVNIYSMNRVLPKVLTLVSEILNEAIFPEEEIVKLRQQQISQHRINLKKTDFVAHQVYNENLFGLTSPYGKKIDLSDIEEISREEIVRYYNAIVQSRPFTVLIAGYVAKGVIKSMEDVFSAHQTIVGLTGDFKVHDFKVNNIIDNWEDAVQTSLRSGRMMPNRKDKDIHKIAVANEILGGYFGSRLMKNIREEKGYTYGIYSRINHLKHASYLTVSAEIIKESKEDALKEINKEIDILLNVPVPKDELEVVKNYMLGTFYNNLSSPFSVLSLFKMLHDSNLEYDYFTDRFRTIQNISSKDLIEIYNKYFDYRQFLSVMVG